MTDSEKNTEEVPPVVADELTEGFLEGVSEPDPLDFVDKPVVAEEPPVVVAEEPPVVAEGGEPPVVEEPGEEPPVLEEPPAVVIDAEYVKNAVQDAVSKVPAPVVAPAPVAAAPEPAAKEPEPPKPALSETEEARLKELEENWGDAAEMHSLQQKNFAAAVAKEVATQLGAAKAEWKAELKPIREGVQLTTEQSYDGAVKEVHPELYNKDESKAFGDELVGWVTEQPKYLQAAYVDAINSADPQDAIDLITRFKNETGKVVAKTDDNAGDPPPVVPEVVDTTAAADKKKRLELLKKPASRQTKSGGDSDDPLDFEGGFNEMVREQERTA